MSERIICRVDHSPVGAKAGAFVAYHLDRDDVSLEMKLALMQEAYPDCELVVER